MCVNNSLKIKTQITTTWQSTQNQHSWIADAQATVSLKMIPCKITKDNKPPRMVRMPNNEKNLSYNTATLNVPTLNEQARNVHVCGDLNNKLLSVGQLCNDWYNVNFNKHKTTVHDNANVILVAKRDFSNGVW
jgi:hypothetical protein